MEFTLNLKLSMLTALPSQLASLWSKPQEPRSIGLSSESLAVIALIDYCQLGKNRLFLLNSYPDY